MIEDPRCSNLAVAGVLQLRKEDKRQPYYNYIWQFIRKEDIYMSETNKKPSMLSDLLLTCLATGALGGAISAFDIIPYLFYPYLLLVSCLAAIYLVKGKKAK